MAKLNILGRVFDIAPYKLGAMIAAAPLIDSQKARQTEIEKRAGVSLSPDDTPEERVEKLVAITNASSMTEMMASLGDAVRILHIGVFRLDPSITVEAMIDDVDPTPAAMVELMTVMTSVLRGSGMEKGEVSAPPAGEPAGA